MTSWWDILLETIPSVLLLLIGGGACVKFREKIIGIFRSGERTPFLKNDSVTTMAAKHILNKSAV